jgi:hypothetical protein
MDRENGAEDFAENDFWAIVEISLAVRLNPHR